jgi:hypothetical protein
MERVATLLQKLQAQLEEKKSISLLLLTVQQIEAELLHLQKTSPSPAVTAHVSIVVPATQKLPVTDLPQQAPAAPIPEVAIATLPPQPPTEPAPVVQTVNTPGAEEKIIEVLQVDEAEIEAELEEIRLNAEARKNMSVHYKPVVSFEESLADNIIDIPTFNHQDQPKPAVKEINDIATEIPSLNDKLRQGTMELGDQLSEAPIRDLKKAIGINDRFLFINDLFRGDETMYERSIKTINGFSILPEAEYWIQRELKVKLGWNDTQETVRQFTQLVKRRFS